MAVVMYTGTPGSGKSYHAAEVVDRALRRKIPVIANFQVNLNPKKHKGEFVYIPTLEMTVDKFKQYAQEHFDSSKRDEHQGVIIIDEAQIQQPRRTEQRPHEVDRVFLAAPALLL